MPGPIPGPFFAHVAEEEPQHFRVARDGDTGGVVGFILAAHFPGADGRMALLTIDPRYRNRGLRRALLRGLQTTLKAEGERWFAAEIPTSNRQDIEFFQRQGYRVVRVQGRAPPEESGRVVLAKQLV